jgi:hypothetical protein
MSESVKLCHQVMAFFELHSDADQDLWRGGTVSPDKYLRQLTQHKSVKIDRLEFI